MYADITQLARKRAISKTIRDICQEKERKNKSQLINIKDLAK